MRRAFPPSFLNCMDTEMTHPDIEKDHAKLVAALSKPGEDILFTLTAEKARLVHMALLICSEAGELADAIKKYAIYNKPIDLMNVIEELGDLEFGMQDVRSLLNISRAQTLKGNLMKLEKRYQGGKYSDKAAQDRADKLDIAEGAPTVHAGSVPADLAPPDTIRPRTPPGTFPPRNHPFVTPHKNRDGDDVI